MHKIRIGILFGLIMSSAAWGECKIWPLVLDTASTLPGASTGITNSGQKISTQIVPNMFAGGAYGSSQIADAPSSNKFAFEYVLQRPLNLSGNEALGATIGAVSDGQGLLFNSSSYGDLAQIDGFPLNVFAISNSSEITPGAPIVEDSNSTKIRVGVYYDQATKKIGIIVNGVDRGYLWSYTYPLSDFAFFVLLSVGGIGGTTAYPVGEYVSYEIVTDHTKLQYSYAYGTTDICGNII